MRALPAPGSSAQVWPRVLVAREGGRTGASLQGSLRAGAEREVAGVGVPSGPRGLAPADWGWACRARSPPTPWTGAARAAGPSALGCGGEGGSRSWDRAGGRETSELGRRLRLGGARTGLIGAWPEREGRAAGGGNRPPAWAPSGGRGALIGARTAE